MIHINVNDFYDEVAVLIVKAKTGVVYSAQTGGLGCHHPECEGFYMPLWNLEFDDCSFGCANIQYDLMLQQRLAIELSDFFERKFNNLKFDVYFDDKRISELQEGWWPVIIMGEIYGNKDVYWEGYIHNGNCD